MHALKDGLRLVSFSSQGRFIARATACTFLQNTISPRDILGICLYPLNCKGTFCCSLCSSFCFFNLTLFLYAHVQSKNTGAHAMEAAMAVRLAHIYGKQHRWPDADASLATTSAALLAAGAGGPCQVAALLRGDLARVRGDVSRRQGAQQQALEHFQAAAEASLSALGTAGRAEEAEGCGGAPGRGGGRQGRDSRAKGSSRAKGRSRGAEGSTGGSAPGGRECRWSLTALLARARLQQAACHISAGSMADACSHLDAACEACASFGPDPSQAFPLHMAAAAFQRALLLDMEQPPPATLETCCLWGSQEMLSMIAAVPPSRSNLGKKAAAAAAAPAKAPGSDDAAMRQLALLLEAYLISRHFPSLSRCCSLPSLTHFICLALALPTLHCRLAFDHRNTMACIPYHMHSVQGMRPMGLFQGPFVSSRCCPLAGK